MAIRNHCVFIGRTGQDVQIKTFQDGNQIGTVSLAVDDSYKSKEGHKVEQTIWVNLVIPNFLCGVFQNYVPKGSRVAVETTYKPRTFQGKDGNTVYMHEFHVRGMEFIDTKKQEITGQQQSAPATSPKPDNQVGYKSDDDIPF